MSGKADFLGFPAGATAIVTGAASGIGHATALALLGQGVRVIGLDINEAGLAALEPGEGFVGRVLDSGDRAAVEAMLPALHAEFGPIAFLVNNAGPPSSMPLSIEDGLAKTAGSVQMMTSNWLALGPPEGASVVNVASVAGTLSGGPPPAMLAGRGDVDANSGWYGAGKAAIGGLTRFQAVIGRGRYRSNAVAPGVVATPRMGDLTAGAYGQMLVERSPLGRLAQAGDVANAIVFLLSPAASYINGVTLLVEGGGTLVF
ncbi:SDR family NAD(P)-dependent oxidoreductase [Sphingomonas colocasiae]|uniref:SDR family oxidoreductase n=1 Tax=Sphingomonas colocasiae TaxID=1848973 RepID=A0ABS7PRF2_9SPHN|nr:SDR family oxidoreductase [Sphingomonas colocasiae]MBY8823916.1 SDR family oxidoreductase [Sphingomonas colocasiae]